MVTKVYDIRINYTNKAIRSIAVELAIIAFFGFAIWYLIDLPVRYLPRELSIPYYLDILPRWLLNFFSGSLILAFVSYLLFDARKNKKGTLKFDDDMIVLESKERCDIIKFQDLKRMTFVALPFAIHRYRLEFIYPDITFKRIKFKNKKQFHEVMDDIYLIAPKDFEIIGSTFETINFRS